MKSFNTVKRTLLVGLAIIAAATMIDASAQAVWLEAGTKCTINKKWSAEASVVYRSHNRWNGNQRVGVGVGVDYKILPWLKADVSYTFMNQNYPERVTSKGNIVSAYWNVRNRGQFALTGSLKLGRLKLSLREQYMVTRRNSRTVAKFDGDDGTPMSPEIVKARTSNTLRSRVQVEYDFKRNPFSPYVSWELFSDIDNRMRGDEWRLTAGTSIKLSRHSSVSVAYRYLHCYYSDDLNVINISYTYKFKL